MLTELKIFNSNPFKFSISFSQIDRGGEEVIPATNMKQILRNNCANWDWLGLTRCSIRDKRICFYTPKHLIFSDHQIDKFSNGTRSVYTNPARYAGRILKTQDFLCTRSLLCGSFIYFAPGTGSTKLYRVDGPQWR